MGHRRIGAQCGDQLGPVSRPRGRFRAISRRGENETRGHHAPGLEAQRAGQHRAKTLNEKAGAGDQHQRECDLGSDERTAWNAAAAADACPAGAGQRALGRGPRRLQRGKNPRQEPGEERGDESKEQHPAIDRDGRRPREVEGEPPDDGDEARRDRGA